MSGAPKAASRVHVQCTVQAAFLVSATFAGRSPLGSTTGSTSSPIKRLLPMAAAPAAVAGIAAAFAFGNGPAAPAAASTTGHQPTTTTATTPKVRASAAAQLLSITQRPTTGVPVVLLNATQVAAVPPKGKHHRTLPDSYTVKSGDTLASIAQRLYVSADYWTVLYWANEDTVHDASAISVGQVLKVPAKPAKIPAAPKTLSPSASTTGTASTPEVTSVQTDSTGSSTTGSGTTGSGTTGSGTTSFQECVIAAESGGNAQIMNSSGHYGLYQFSYSTWVAYGGNAADFGHATVAEQNQVFDNAIAAGGESNWAPYDGC
jgi:LysM repeat protein